MLRWRQTRNDNEALLGPPSMLATLGLTDGGDGVSPAWVQQSLRSVSSLWPIFILVKLCLLASIANIGPLLNASAYTLLLLAVTLASDAVIAMLHLVRPLDRMKSYWQMRLMCALVFVSALFTVLWSHSLPPSMSDHGLVSATMVQAALVLLATSIFGHLRILGLAYCGGAIVCMIGFHGPHLALLSVAVLAGMGAAALFQARRDGQRLLAHDVQDVRSRRAHRLLTEYEEAGHGWFWETDRTGALAYISPTLARSLGLRTEEVIGRPLTDLVGTGGGQSESDRTLGFHLSVRSAFHDVAVSVRADEEERWWALSGRPIINDYGHFHGFRGSGYDLTATKRSQAEVARLAAFDSLTGIANRVQMQRALEQCVGTPGGLAGACALFLLDLDRFKAVNDTMGHPAGDALLRQVAERLQRVVGDRGMVGRLGGDEFKVLLPDLADRTRLGALADAIIAALSHPYIVEGVQVVIGASVGIAVCPDDGFSADTLTRNADLALYAAKAQGRGVHRFYSSDMLTQVEDRRQLEDDLRSALANNALDLVYQPVVDAAEEQVVGVEALLRWNHPVRGPIPPSDFIPVAEESGLIGPLGEWVMRAACAAASEWPDRIRVSVNVSPIQFANPAFPGVVMSALGSSGLAPARLELEITESAFLKEGEATERMFAQLKAIGVRLALDDFGTGYSSLGYLRKAPFDTIKIDRAFVQGAAVEGSRNAAIISSIVNLAHALGMDTTAEGVETKEELELVRVLGCSHIQGFIYGKGESAAAVGERFAGQGVPISTADVKPGRSRRVTMLRSVAILYEGQRYFARIRNISSGGAMIEGLWSVQPGARIMVTLGDGLSVEAMVRWSVSGRVGLQFAKPVELGALRAAGTVRMAG